MPPIPIGKHPIILADDFASQLSAIILSRISLRPLKRADRSANVLAMLQPVCLWICITIEKNRNSGVGILLIASAIASLNSMPIA